MTTNTPTTAWPSDSQIDVTAHNYAREHSKGDSGYTTRASTFAAAYYFLTPIHTAEVTRLTQQLEVAMEALELLETFKDEAVHGITSQTLARIEEYEQ